MRIKSMEVFDLEALRTAFVYEPETGLIARRLKNGEPRTYRGATDKVRYPQFNYNGARFTRHRLAWFLHYGREPVGEIDHINGNRNDNRIANLRECSHSENQRNRPALATNKSGFKGVNLHGPTGKYRAKIMADGVDHHLGLFATAEEASAVYQEAAARLHGEFARS